MAPYFRQTTYSKNRNHAFAVKMETRDLSIAKQGWANIANSQAVVCRLSSRKRATSPGE